LEDAEGAAALRVLLTLRDALPVEVRHLLKQVVVLQQHRAVRAHGQRVLVAGYRDASVGRRRATLLCGRHGTLLTLSVVDLPGGAQRGSLLTVSICWRPGHLLRPLPARSRRKPRSRPRAG